MTISRTLTLATVAAAGLVGLAQPASAAAGSDYEVWRANHGTSTAASGSDLANWQTNFGTSAAASFDGDGDVDVDGRDFLVWRRG